MANRTREFKQSSSQSVAEARDACSAAIDLSDVYNAAACFKALLKRPPRPSEDHDKMSEGIVSFVRLITETLDRRKVDATEAFKVLFEELDRKEV